MEKPNDLELVKLGSYIEDSDLDQKEVMKAESLDPETIEETKIMDTLKLIESRMDYWDKVKADSESAIQAIQKTPEIQLDVVSTDFGKNRLEAIEALASLAQKHERLLKRLNVDIEEIPADEVELIDDQRKTG